MLRGLFSGELRQGAQAGLLADAIARAAEVPGPAVRRALLLAGDLKTVAVAALDRRGRPALAEFALAGRAAAGADAGAQRAERRRGARRRPARRRRST